MTQDPHSDELGAAIRAAVADVRAPAALRARVEAEHAARRRPRARRRFPTLGFAGAAASLVCATVLVLALGLIGGEQRTEGATLARAATLALRSNPGPAPAEDENNNVLIDAGIGGLRFPYWDDEFGLEATAIRADQISARSAMTVEYRGDGQRIGYTIVAGPALKAPREARTVRRRSLTLTVLRQNGATVVAWRRGGHTCVLASRDASAARLVKLAAWTGNGRIPGYGG
jgi:hypothetical protein